MDCSFYPGETLLNVTEKNTSRLKQSIQLALKKGKGELQVANMENVFRNFSKHLMCSTSGMALPPPEPNLFSFNSPKGACEICNGLGYINEIEVKKIIPNDISFFFFMPKNEYNPIPI